MTLTTMSLILAGCVRIVCTSVMRSAGNRRPWAAPAGPREKIPCSAAAISGRPMDAKPAADMLTKSRRSMVHLLDVVGRLLLAVFFCCVNRRDFLTDPFHKGTHERRLIDGCRAMEELLDLFHR